MVEANVWILDIVQEYLQSPQWKSPILDFIEDNCVIFDDEDENKHEYLTVHREFKRLVDEQLEEYITEIGIPPAEFVKACQHAVSNGHKKTVAQILAVEDFPLFKKMMVNRNKAMNQEAMEALKKQGKKMNAQLEEQVEAEAEDAELAAAIAESKAMMEAAEAAKKLEEQELELQKKRSMQSESAFAEAEPAKKEEVKQEVPQQQQEQPKQQEAPKQEEVKKPEPEPVQNNSAFPSLNSGKPSALPSLNGGNKMNLFEDINIEEGDTEEVREVKEQKKELLEMKKQMQTEAKEKRNQELNSAREAANDTEAEKAERIKKGMAALGQNQGNSEEELAQKRKNIYHDIGAALKENKQQ